MGRIKEKMIEAEDKFGIDDAEAQLEYATQGSEGLDIPDDDRAELEKQAAEEAAWAIVGPRVIAWLEERAESDRRMAWRESERITKGFASAYTAQDVLMYATKADALETAVFLLKGGEHTRALTGLLFDKRD